MLKVIKREYLIKSETFQTLSHILLLFAQKSQLKLFSENMQTEYCSVVCKLRRAKSQIKIYASN